VTSVLVSLVTHNESKDVEHLLPSLFAQTHRDLALFALDNNSQEGTRSTLAAFQRKAPIPMTLVASKENLGFTGGHNKGIEKAIETGADWVLVVNADVTLPPELVERLLAEATEPRHARVASFTPKVRRAEGPDLVPTDRIDTVGFRMTRSGRHFDIAAGLRDDGSFDRPAEIFGVSGCLALYRTAALREAKISTGFFDDDFFLYREDVDLAWRLRAFGWSARCVPAAVAYHRRRSLPERRRLMSAVANLHSVKNRFLLRINNAGRDHIQATFPKTFLRDLTVVGGCLTVERTSLHALKWLAENHDRLLEKREDIQRRRTVSDREILRWFGDDPHGGRLEDGA